MEKPLIIAGRNYTSTPDLNMFSMHTHENYEIYCFLSGHARYFVEGTVYDLRPGDIMILKKAEAHTLLIQSFIPYERIVINFEAEALLTDRGEELRKFLDNRPLGEQNRYAAADFSDSHWKFYLDRICMSDEMEEKRLYLTILIYELWKSGPRMEYDSIKKDSTTEMIAYINRHLTEPLDLDLLCQRFFISKSQLNRRFRRVTGSTVWDYILTKRLLMAKELLQNGERPGNVAQACGFQDYGAFFRAYKTKFLCAPKVHYRKQ